MDTGRVHGKEYAMTVVRESVDRVPLCPHCESPLEEVVWRVVRTTGRSSPEFRFGKRYIYACPACRTALGISHRKGFWVG